LLAAVSAAYDGAIVMIDPSCVRVHQHGAAVKRGPDVGDGGMGCSRGGLTTRIHALVDADGRPVRLELTPGHADDAPVAAAFMESLEPGATPIADRAYDTNAIRALAAERGAWANIPPRSIRKGSFAFSAWVYRQRNLVERFFNRIKQFHGLATRHDRRPENDLAALKLAAVRIWLAAI
jgi:transposase